MFDLGLIHVRRLIVHEIPRRYLKPEASPGEEPILSEVESPLEDDVRNFFQERLVSSLSSGYEVEFDPSSESGVPGILRGLLAEPPLEFVAASHDLARSLFQSQGGVNPPGLLTLMEIGMGSRTGIAVVKLEKEEGARIQRAKVGGRLTFNVSHLRDLMLTQKTRVFKVGLFATAAGKTETDGLVCDQQKGAGTTVAFFFLGNFLGCRLKEVAEVTTKRFFEATERFINDDVESPEKKARYEIALVAEMQTTRKSVAPEAFANTNLSTDDRSAFLARVTEAGVTARSFAKDVTLVEPKLRRLQWTFKSGIAVMAAAEHVGDQLQVEGQADGRTKLEIVDELSDFKGHR